MDQAMYALARGLVDKDQDIEYFDKQEGVFRSVNSYAFGSDRYGKLVTERGVRDPLWEWAMTLFAASRSSTTLSGPLAIASETRRATSIPVGTGFADPPLGNTAWSAQKQFRTWWKRP